MNKTIITIPCCLLLLFTSMDTLASEPATAPQSYIAIGAQFTEVSADGMRSYFGDLYNNDVQKDLLGYYIDAKWHFHQHFFVQVNHDDTTRSSTDLTQSYFNLGTSVSLTKDTQWFSSLGYASYKADRRTSKGEHRKNDGHGISAETGLTLQLAPWFQTQPSYRFANFEHGGQHQFNLKNQFLLGAHSAIELNISYRDWQQLGEMGYQLGYRYRF
ncbi:hypothetical protein EKG38_01690 [Shewanella canadensis]|uniref:Porin family protein n=1 Tax=Shewanella canadensis TaxID=271096 RepID=A0A3S0J9F0_9GAMM|nr:hypothetical protein [Shewanella canadensis]RTR40656.1 hypothetical protein EKG38_01690 [Shewanella canadensis]